MASSNCVHMDRFNLHECVQWIESKRARNVCLYFLPQFYCLASEIATHLKQKCPHANFLVMISGSSGVDMVKYRTKDPKCAPDAVIHFGASCLCVAKYSSELSILFMPLVKDASELEYISEHLARSIEEYSAKKVLLVADLTNSWILLDQNRSLLSSKSNCALDVSKYVQPDANNWYFAQTCFNLFDTSMPHPASNCLYLPYLIPNQLSHYDLVLFVGDCKNMEFIINCKRLIVVDPLQRRSQSFDGLKEFRKRSSLIEKFKSQAGNLTGVVFVNYTQSVTPIMNRTKVLCKKLKKVPYFLSLNQADIEMRLGNFGQLESFVLVNSCDCNFEVALNTSKYLYPVIFWKEFLLVCGQRISYGGIQWNEDDSQQEENDDEASEEQQDEESMRLVERDLFKRPDGWFGLVVDAGSQQASQVKEGLRGIPSSYTNEEELF